jgi:uncharacterized protein (TIGR04255 family)
VTFDEETHQRLRFQHNPLKIVVAQVRYPTMHQLATPDVLAAIQADLAERFPKPLPPLQEITFGMTPQGPTTPQVQRAAERFGAPDDRLILAIGQETASVETIDYRGWEDFSVELRDLLELVERRAPVTRVARFGLRYVDELTLDGVATIADWAELVADNLLGGPEGMARDPRAVRTLQRVTIRVGDDVVNLNHGFTVGGEGGTDGPSVYLIDTDIFDPNPRDWDIDGIMATASRFHDWATNIFVRSLSQAGIERLGGAPR